MTTHIRLLSISRYISFLLICIYSSSLVLAQEVKSEKNDKLKIKLDVNAVTLFALLQCARTNNPGWKIAQSELEVAFSKLDFAKRSRFPTLNITSTFAPLPARKLLKYCVNTAGSSPQQVVVCENQDVQDDQRIDEIDGMGVFYRNTANLTQTLYTFGKITHGIAAAEKGVQAYRAGLRLAQQAFDPLAIETYYGILLTKSALKVFKDGLSYMRRFKKKIQKDLDQQDGNYTSNDKRRVIIQEAELLARQAEVLSIQQQAWRGIRISCKLSASQKLVLDRKKIRAFKVEIANEDHYLQLAQQHRPELQAAKMAIGAQQSLVDLSKANFLPNLALIGFFIYNVATSAEDNPDPFASDPFNVFSYGAYLGLEWKLNFAQLTSRYRKSQANYSKSRAQFEAVKLQVQMEINEAYQLVQRYKKILKARKTAKRMGKQWMRSVTMNLSTGFIQSNDLLDSLRAYYSSDLNYQQTIYEYNKAVTTLWKASGLDLSTLVED
jgi:outer membrane protein TolC